MIGDRNPIPQKVFGGGTRARPMVGTTRTRDPSVENP